MINSGNLQHGFLLGFLTMLRHISAGIVAVSLLFLLLGMFAVPVSTPYQALAIVSFLLSLILLGWRESHSRISTRKFYLDRAVSITTYWLLIIGILLALGYVTKSSAIFSRRVLLIWFVSAPPIILVAQLMLDRLIDAILSSAGNVKRVVIAGANELSSQLANRILHNPQLGMTVIGRFDDRSRDRLGPNSNIDLIGNLRDLPDFVRQNKIDVIFVALPIRNVSRVTELLDELHDTTASIYYAPDVFVFDLIQCRTDSIGNLPVVALCETPFYGFRGLIKRTSDIVLGSIILILTSPIMLAIAIAVKLSTPGSVVFTQRRYGLDGREIIVYKFRTMTVSEDSGEVRQASRDDARITRVGSFLRRYSLDELPQFINVIQGRMSVVGPRPHAVAHNEQYRSLIKGYMIRHKVNPGITGLAQIRGFRGETETVDDMRRRVEADLEYLRNWSLDLDIKIILRTIAMMVSDKNAY